jgi:hypothetical protein
MKVGDRVLHKATGRVAYVERHASDIPGGLRLDRSIEGFSWWNAQDLKKLPALKKKRPKP